MSDRPEGDMKAMTEWAAKAQAAGVQREDIVRTLVGAGWPKDEVDRCLDALPPAIPPPLWPTDNRSASPQRGQARNPGVLWAVAISMFVIGTFFGAWLTPRTNRAGAKDAAVLQGPVGDWTGRVYVDALPPNASAEAKTAHETLLNTASKAVLTLHITTDEAYVMSVKGVPNGTSTVSGTWSQSGSTVTMRSSANATTQWTLDPAGNTLTVTLPGVSSGAGGRVVFTRS